MKMIKWVILLLSLSFAVAASAREESLKIPQLDKMHEVIHPMWHKAYPNKDVELLKSLYPQLKTDVSALAEVKIPDTFKDKQHRWSIGITQMQDVLKNYKSAMDKNDSTALLDAAKQIHSAYEFLVDVVNPPLPAMDNFHKVLYSVFHEYLPNEEWNKVKETIPAFQEKMALLNKAELPGRFKAKKAEFDQARSALSEKVDALGKLKNTNDNEKLKEAVLSMHNAYEKLEGIVE